MFVRLGIEAPRGLRGCLFGLSSSLLILFASTHAAVARRHHHHHHHAAYDPPYASIVVDANTGKVLQATNPDGLRHPASLTKVMTLYLLFERLKAKKLSLNTALPVSRHASVQPPTKLGLKPGQSIRVDTAIKALVTRSANDVAVVIAEAIGGSESAFARMMTRKARALGMYHTVYVNASGLPNDNQITTARDEAILGRAIQERFPHYYHYFSIQSFDYHGRRIRNHNHLLGRVEGVDGIKTGFTYDSGFNLLTSMWRGHRHIVAVVLGGRSAAARDAKMRRLLASHIMMASTHRTSSVLARAAHDRKVRQLAARAAAAQASEHVPTPVERPLVLHKVAANDETASIGGAPDVTAFRAAAHPHLGSTDPIKPLPVDTVTIKPSTRITLGAIGFDGKIGAHVPAPPPRPESRDDRHAAEVAEATDKASDGDADSSHKVVRSGWMIQVGAFGDEAEARRHLSAAQRRVNRLLGDADPFTETYTKGDTIYYRARFAGLDKHQAKAACRALKRRDIACFTLKN